MLGWIITIAGIIGTLHIATKRRAMRRKISRQHKDQTLLAPRKRGHECLRHLWQSPRAISTLIYTEISPSGKRVSIDLGPYYLDDAEQVAVYRAWVEIFGAAGHTELGDSAVTRANAKRIAVSLVPHCIEPAMTGQDADILRTIQDVGMIALAEARDDYVLEPIFRE